MPLSIAFCTDGIYPHVLGGMQKHSKLLIEELAKDDSLELTVLHPHPFTVFNNGRIKEISVQPLDNSKNYLLQCYKYSKRVAGHLAGMKADVIYSQGLCVWH